LASRIARLLLLFVLLLLPLALLSGNKPLYATTPVLPRAVPISLSSEQARQASQYFWDAFHGNDYDRVDDVIAHLTAAYAEYPDDPTLAMLLGMSHYWKFQERGRASLKVAEVLPHLELALRHLQKAQELNPRDRIVPGFVEGGKATLGLLTGDAALEEEGLRGLRRVGRLDATAQGFTIGLVYSAVLSERDCRYAEGIEGFFTNMDGCAHFPIPRHFPYAPRPIYHWLALQARKDPVCYNNDIVPHNFEGLGLALGDAFLKEGKMCQAALAYKSIKDSPNYCRWPYKSQLETRLKNMEALKCKFRAETAQFDVPEPALFLQSSYSCTACHAR
jgi:hypothetical protein